MKKYRWLWLAVVIAMVVAACGGDGGDGATTTAGDGAATTAGDGATTTAGGGAAGDTGYEHLDRAMAGEFEGTTVDIVAQWQDAWDEYVAEGWVRIGDRRIELTRAGLLRVDALLPAFFEPQFQNVRYT